MGYPSGTLASGVTTIFITKLAELAAGDVVDVRVFFGTNAAGVYASYSGFWGMQIA